MELPLTTMMSQSPHISLLSRAHSARIVPITAWTATVMNNASVTTCVLTRVVVALTGTMSVHFASHVAAKLVGPVRVALVVPRSGGLVPVPKQNLLLSWTAEFNPRWSDSLFFTLLCSDVYMLRTYDVYYLTVRCCLILSRYERKFEDF